MRDLAACTTSTDPGPTTATATGAFAERAEWAPAPTQWIGTGERKPRTVSIAGSFAVDGLEGPLSVWLDEITGLTSTVSLKWVSLYRLTTVDPRPPIACVGLPLVMCEPPLP
jgi:hypothetical protein